MTKFIQPFQLLAHDKTGTSDCSEKDETEVVLVDNSAEPPYWCTVQELLQDVRKRARITERQNKKPAQENNDVNCLVPTLPAEGDNPLETTLND